MCSKKARNKFGFVFFEAFFLNRIYRAVCNEIVTLSEANKFAPPVQKMPIAMNIIKTSHFDNVQNKISCKYIGALS